MPGTPAALQKLSKDKSGDSMMSAGNSSVQAKVCGVSYANRYFCQGYPEQKGTGTATSSCARDQHTWYEQSLISQPQYSHTPNADHAVYWSCSDESSSAAETSVHHTYQKDLVWCSYNLR